MPPAPLTVGSIGDANFSTPADSDQIAQTVQCDRPATSGGESVPAALLAPTERGSRLQQAENAFELAQESDIRPSDACVDQYYHAVTHAWHCLTAPGPVDPLQYARAWDLYHRGLERLIIAGQQHGRLDPRSGLVVYTSAGAALVPIAYHGFPWRPEDFSQLIIVDGQGSHTLQRYWQHSGLGVPLVAVRIRGRDDRFLSDKIPWSTTAVLRPNCVASPPAGNNATRSHTVASLQTSPPVVATLELHDPLRNRSTHLGLQEISIHRDLSAPMAFLMENTDRGWLDAFLRPGTSNQQSALRMLEPYQSGKIPVVFVHGLLSDPATWINVANELRAVPWIVNRYQIWAYRYPTGEPFLDSAAKFRELLYEAVATCDHAGHDRALQQIVLIGHSMGGLISKLQVTQSQTKLWDAVANRPLDAIRADPQARERLRRLFFFEPQPSVTRVVFVGTPHQGSSWARRIVGASWFASDHRTGRRVRVTGNPGPQQPRRVCPANPRTYTHQC